MTSSLAVSDTQISETPRWCMMSIASIKRFTFIVLLSSLLKSKRESSSAARCVITAIRTTPNWNVESRKRSRASVPVLSVKFKIHFNELWSTLKVKLISSRHGRDNSTAHIVECYSRGVILYLRTAPVRDLNENSIASVVLTSYCCMIPHQTRTVQGSASKVI